MVRKLLKNKKGDAWESTNFQWYLLFSIPLALVLLSAFIFVGDSSLTSIVTVESSLDTDLLISRFLYSPDCFVYEDPNTMKAYPFVIDAEKFTSERLDECMDAEHMSFMIMIVWDGVDIGGRTIKNSEWGSPDEGIQKSISVFDGKLYTGEMYIMIDKKE